MTRDAALAALADACARPLAVADRLRAGGRRVVWTLGVDIPPAMVEGCGCAAIRLVPQAGVESRIGDLIGAETLSPRGRALLGAIDSLDPGDAVLISHADSEQPQLFATLRELTRVGAIVAPRVHFIDLLTIDREPTRVYNRNRVDQAIAWLGGADDAALGRAMAVRDAQARALAALLARRVDAGLSGADVHRLLAAAAVLPPPEMAPLIEALATSDGAAPAGHPIFLSGSTIEDPAIVEAIEAAGALVVGEDHGWGAPRVRQYDPSLPVRDALACWTLGPRSGPFSSAERRAAEIARHGVRRIVHLELAADDSAPWEAAAIARCAGDAAVLRLKMPIDAAVLRSFLADGSARPVAAAPRAAEVRRSAPPPPTPQRSRKSLAVLARFGSYQREWFAAIREQAAAGAVFAAVNANAPQEILRALDIPFVVNQWWASIVAAKQQSRRYAGLLEAAGLPSATEAYSAQGVAAALDDDAAQAPWGGLPKADVLAAVLTTDATPRLFEAWAQLTGARLQRYERSIESRWEIPIDWWDGLAEQWDSFIEPERLDLFEAELRLAIAELEAITGRTFDLDRFRAILDLVNEQQDYYRRARDLIAQTVPAPVSVVDTMPATMVPQWHRGTVWARDAARDFYLEVRERCERGEGACPNERLRLMFVGRGIWSDMSFYQRWEASHGAVFVCSMYLSLAADGYIRRHDRGRDPVRALAARFVTMGDELRMPTWAGAWHVKEARLHGCHGAMALADADPLVIRALREAGIPVLELGIDNFAHDPGAEAAMARRAAEFLDGLLAAG